MLRATSNRALGCQRTKDLVGGPLGSVEDDPTTCQRTWVQPIRPCLPKSRCASSCRLLPCIAMTGSKDEVSRFWEKQAPVYNAAPRSQSREQEPRHLFA